MGKNLKILKFRPLNLNLKILNYVVGYVYSVLAFG